jgi:tRNA pseudouridine38-40 synthase
LARYRALVEYDGSAYHGFQRQLPDQPTIQGELERALTYLAGKPVTVIGSGRTDSGVHALGQVVVFSLSWRHGAGALLRALNANLPRDIAILQVTAVAADFHPRYDAHSRTYHYRILNRPVRSPTERRRSWHVSRPLNLEAMEQAAQVLVGEHDFATFGSPPQGDNSVRRVFHVHWRRDDAVRFVFEITATAYLYRMVRGIVGTLKLVGEGFRSVDDFVAAFQARDRNLCGNVAPAHGLYLISVTYRVTGRQGDQVTR